MNGLHAVLTIASGRRAKWAVLVFWLVMLGVFGSLSAKLTGAEQNNIQAWLPGSAQSTKVLALEARLQSPNIFTAVVVYDRPASGGGFLPLTSADRAKAAADARQFASVPGVVKSQIAGPIAAANGKAVETIVPVNLGSKGYDGASTAADRLRAISLADAGGLASHIAGPLGNAADSASAFSGISGTLLGATLGVVIVLLLLTYRSPVLWLLPVISAAAALSTSEGVVYLLTKYLTVNAQSAGILDVLVFGAATDYALLLTARYREELRHEDRHEAMAIALRRAGPAIIASAATVIASLLTLSAADLNSTKDMGPVLAIGVAVALMAMLTLLPALLVICGRWVFWPARPAFGTEEPSSRGLWARTGGLIARRPRAVWLATVLVLGAMAVGLTGLKASGLTNAQTFRGHPDSVTGQTVIDQNFPAAAGDGAPVQVVANAAQAAPVAAAFRAVPGITAVTAPVTVDGHAYLNGTLTVPPDSQAAYATVDRVRAATSAVPGADAQVGGTSATSLDVQQANTHDREVIIPVILAVVLVILMLLLRALVAPVMLIATVVLSFLAALGVSSLFFNHVFGFGGADASFPLLAFVFLVSLGIDYNIFLMTRVREETARHGARQGALTGLAATDGVIVSAGLVLAGTFAALATLPLTMMTELGFAVAFGVLLDTIVVRSVLVTALNLDLGRWVWWPSALARSPVPASGQLEERPSPVP